MDTDLHNMDVFPVSNKDMNNQYNDKKIFFPTKWGLNQSFWSSLGTKNQDQTIA